MGERTAFYKRFCTRMRMLSVATGAIIALIPSLTFFSMNWGDQKLRADYLCGEVTRQLRTTVKANPELWKFSVVKFMQVFDEIESAEIVEIRIFDSDGTLLERETFDVPSVVRRTGGSDIVYNNVRFGRVELDKVADSALYSTLLLFLGFSLLAACVSFALFRYPAAIVRRAEDSINVTIDRLNREVLDRTRREMEIGESLREKEILLKEVHHRVKNNLQIIISLINLQYYETEREGSGEMLLSFKHRVSTLALVHERLYESPSLSLIDMKAYLNSLIIGYMDSYRSDDKAIRYTVEADGLSLQIDYAIPLGLIVCELVTNSFKYAFEGRKRGLVEVELRRTGDQRLRLYVGDDGIGLTEGMREGKRGLGLELVKSLAAQVHGELSIESSSGLKAIVDGIELDAPSPRS